MYQRTENFIHQHINTADSDAEITVVTHAGVIRCFLAKYLHIPLNKVFTISLDYGAVIKIKLYPDFEQVEMIKTIDKR